MCFVSSTSNLVHARVCRDPNLFRVAVVRSNPDVLSQDDLQKQLDTANAQIKQLQESAANELRQRKPQAEAAVNQMQEKLQNAPAPGGVPIQYVAAACLLAFLIAYLFF